jgi:hypothetical protein
MKEKSCASQTIFYQNLALLCFAIYLCVNAKIIHAVRRKSKTILKWMNLYPFGGSNGEQPAIGLVHYKMDEFENREGGGKSVHGSGRHVCLHRSPTIISARRLRDGLGSRIPAMPGRARRARSPGLRCQSGEADNKRGSIQSISQSEMSPARHAPSPAPHAIASDPSVHGHRT